MRAQHALAPHHADLEARLALDGGHQRDEGIDREVDIARGLAGLAQHAAELQRHRSTDRQAAASGLGAEAERSDDSRRRPQQPPSHCRLRRRVGFGTLAKQPLLAHLASRRRQIPWAGSWRCAGARRHGARPSASARPTSHKARPASFAAMSPAFCMGWLVCCTVTRLQRAVTKGSNAPRPCRRRPTAR